MRTDKTKEAYSNTYNEYTVASKRALRGHRTFEYLCKVLRECSFLSAATLRKRAGELGQSKYLGTSMQIITRPFIWIGVHTGCADQRSNVCCKHGPAQNE